MVKYINKHVYTWVGTFLFGGIGVDRFMRGQVGLGILKLLTFGLGFLIFGLGGIWVLVDWIIALTKLGQYKKEFVFMEGFFCNHCEMMESWTCLKCGKTGNKSDMCGGCYTVEIRALECSLCHNTIKYRKGMWRKP